MGGWQAVPAEATSQARSRAGMGMATAAAAALRHAQSGGTMPKITFFANN